MQTKGLYSFPHRGVLLVEMRFLTRQDPCKNPLKYKEEIPSQTIYNQRSKVASNGATPFDEQKHDKEDPPPPIAKF
jgi:hypothetical protein